MDLNGVLAALRRWWPVVVAMTLIGAGVGLAHTALAQERYEASATVFFSLERGETVSELAQGSSYTLELVQSYASVATMPIVLDPVIAELGLSTTPAALAEDVTARAPLGTVLLEITATQPTADGAAEVADAVADRLSGAVKELSSGKDDAGSITVTTTSSASVPASASASWPRPALDVGVGLLGGLMLGLAAALVLGTVAARVDGRDALSRLTGVPLVGSLPDDPRGRTSVVSSPSAPLGARSEAYRALRTNLEFLRASPSAGTEAAGGLAGGGQLVVVTSSVGGEGKTTTAANLAAAIADTGQRVLLIDADLRRPAVATTLGLEGSVGLTTVLVGRASLGDVVQLWGPGALRVLTSGDLPPNPSELLASPMMARLMAAVRRDHDVVVLDTAPVLPVTDAAVLASRTDGALVVVDARRTPARKVAETLTRLSTAGAPVLGMVLNRTARERDDYYGHRPSRRPWRRGASAGGGHVVPLAATQPPPVETRVAGERYVAAEDLPADDAPAVGPVEDDPADDTTGPPGGPPPRAGISGRAPTSSGSVRGGATGAGGAGPAPAPPRR